MQQMLLFLCLSLLLVLLCKANGDEAAGYLVIEHAVNSPYDNKMAKAFSFNSDSSSIELSLRAGKEDHQTMQVSDSLCIGYSGKGNVGLCINESCHEVPFYFQDIGSDPRRGIASLSEGDLIVVVLPGIRPILAKDLRLASSLAQSQRDLPKENVEQWLDETFKNSTSTIILLKYTKHPGSIPQVDIGAARKPLLFFSAEQQWLNWNIEKDSDVHYQFDDYNIKLDRSSAQRLYSTVSATFIGPSLAHIVGWSVAWILFRNGECISRPPLRGANQIYDGQFYSQNLALQPNDILILLIPLDHNDAYAKVKLKRIIEAGMNVGLEKVQAMTNDSVADWWKLWDVLGKLYDEKASISGLYHKLTDAQQELAHARSNYCPKPMFSQLVAKLEERLGGHDWAKSCLELLIQADERITELHKELVLLGQYDIPKQAHAMANKHIDKVKAALATNDDYATKSKKVLDMTRAYLAKLELLYATYLAQLELLYETYESIAAVFTAAGRVHPAVESARSLDSMAAVASSYILALERELAATSDHKINSEKVLAVADKFAPALRTVMGLPDIVPDALETPALEIPALTGEFGTDLDKVLDVARRYLNKASSSIPEEIHAIHEIYAVSLTIVADASKDHEGSAAIGGPQTGIKRNRADVDDANQEHIDHNSADEPQHKKQQTGYTK